MRQPPAPLLTLALLLGGGVLSLGQAQQETVTPPPMPPSVIEKQPTVTPVTTPTPAVPATPAPPATTTPATDSPGRVTAPSTESPTPPPTTQPTAPEAPTTAPAATPSAPVNPPPASSTQAPAAASDGDQPTEHELAGRCIEGSEQSCMMLSRQGKDGKAHRILVVRTGTSDDTGIYTICGPQDNDPEGTPNIGVFSETGTGGIRIVIDKNVIKVPLAVVTQQPAKDGQDGSDGRVEASAGTARFLDSAPEGAKDQLSRCGVETKPKPAPDTVVVTQGKTRLQGQKLVYDASDGLAHIDGPITFKRDNDKDPLSGTSDSIEVNVDDEKTVLVGNVTLTSEGGRISKAGRVEYDDTLNEARLYPTKDQPAESVKGTDKITMSSGGYILYHLNNSEVVMVGEKGANISGEFKDGDDSTDQPQ